MTATASRDSRSDRSLRLSRRPIEPPRPDVPRVSFTLFHYHGHVRRLLRSLARVALLFVLASGIALGQAHRAAIRGIVADPAGQRMRGVEVRVMNEHTRESRHVKTDHEGRYTVAEVPPGLYRLTIDHPGYGRFIARTELAMNQDYWLNVALQA